MAQLVKKPIHEAAQNGDVDALRRELESGVSPDTPGPYGLRPLHFVPTHDADNRVACIHLLIDAGADVAAVTQENRMTALSFAASGGHATLACALIDAGSDVNHRSSSEWTPLHHAMYRNGSSECARLFINAGAAVDARCSAGLTPLDHCIKQCRRDVESENYAVLQKRRRLYPILLRAGATLQTRLYYDDYLLKVRAAGGFRRYERAHLNALAATFLPKLPSLPPEMVRRVVEYAFHVGDY